MMFNQVTSNVLGLFGRRFFLLQIVASHSALQLFVHVLVTVIVP